jgi:spermidine synthase
MLKTIGGHCIYQTVSGIKVYQNILYRWLTMGSSALQTLIHRKHLERPGLRYIHHLKVAACEQPGDCCLLGLGGAGIAHALAPYMGASKLIAVENNVEIITIANDYFMSNCINNLLICHQDAGQFVQLSKESFQHVIVDLYGANEFPAHCNTPEFFANCRSLLRMGGILAVNIANGSEHWPILQCIQASFPLCTILLPVKGTANMVVLACNGLSVDPLLEILKKKKALKKLSWSAQWGCIAELC